MNILFKKQTYFTRLIIDKLSICLVSVKTKNKADKFLFFIYYIETWGLIIVSVYLTWTKGWILQYEFEYRPGYVFFFFFFFNFFRLLLLDCLINICDVRVGLWI